MDIGRDTKRTLLASVCIAATLAMALAGMPADYSSHAADGAAVSAQTDSSSVWSVQTVESSQPGENFSLKLDSNGMPHVAMSTGRLSYASLEGGSWVVQSVDTAVQLFQPSLVLDSHDYAHISYIRGIRLTNPSQRELRYAAWNGSNWIVQVVANLGDDFGGWTSIALDANDRPHIAYTDHNSLKYASWSGTVWNLQTVDTLGCQTIYPSLALDAADVPHISYNCDGLRSATWNGTQWQTQVVDSSNVGQGDTSLSLDPSGNAHIAYNTGVPLRQLRYVSWTGTAWTSPEVVADHISLEEPGITLDIDSLGVAHISYAGGGGALSVATLQDAGWNINVVPGATQGTWRPSMALDRNQKAQIVYYGPFPPEQLFYVREDSSPGGWTNPQLVAEPSRLGSSASLVVDHSNHPHISYLDQDQRTLRYATWDGSQWSNQFVDNVVDWHLYSSIRTDSDNLPHIAYFANGALKYASWDGNQWTTEFVAGQRGRYASLALDSTSNSPRIAYCSLGLWYASWNGNSWDIQKVDANCGGGDFGGETSLALDASGYPHIAYYSGGASHYVSWDGSRWTSPSTVDTGTVSESLALDSTGTPHIAYCGQSNFVPEYASWNGVSWDTAVIENPHPTAPNTCGGISLALDNDDIPHVSYTDIMTTDIRYDSWNGSSWTGQVVDGDVGWTGNAYSPIAIGTDGAAWIAYPSYYSFNLMVAQQVQGLAISGNAGIGQAVLSYTDGNGNPQVATADSSGTYSFRVLQGWTGRVTPSKTGYTFIPAFVDYDGVTTDQTGKNYTATLMTFQISGNADVPNATISYSGGGSTTAGGTGLYSLIVPYGSSGTVTPSKTGYRFTPSSLAYNNVIVDYTAQNYSALAFPTNIRASDGTYTNRVLVTWTAAPGAPTYWVYRTLSAAAVGPTVLGSTRVTSFGDTTATPGVTYYYWVTAGANFNAASSNDTGWRALLPPTGVQASDGTFGIKVLVGWRAALGATSYKVYRARSATGAKSLLGSPAALAFNDTTATRGVTYYYWVVAYRGARHSGYSAANTGWRRR